LEWEGCFPPPGVWESSPLGVGDRETTGRPDHSKLGGYVDEFSDDG